MSCVKPHPAVLPGGQTEGLQGPGSCRVWQQTAAFTVGKTTEDWEAEKTFHDIVHDINVRGVAGSLQPHLVHIRHIVHVSF